MSSSFCISEMPSVGERILEGTNMSSDSTIIGTISLFKNSVFLYGLGMVYFHFNTFDWHVLLFQSQTSCLLYFVNWLYLCSAIQSFQQLLLIDKSFTHSTEVHVRLAIMYKVRGDFQPSLDVSACLSLWHHETY